MQRKWRQTSCNECWTLRLEWSPVRRSSSEACRGFFTLSCIGSMYQSESCTSSVSWCSAACLHGQAPQYLFVCKPVSDVASRRHFRSAGRRLLNALHQKCTKNGVHLPGWLSLWLAHWCGIRCRTIPQRPGSWQRHFLQAPKEFLTHTAH